MNSWQGERHNDVCYKKKMIYFDKVNNYWYGLNAHKKSDWAHYQSSHVNALSERHPLISFYSSWHGLHWYDSGIRLCSMA